tara:strand:- start:130 stop:384 length:255 start_codon:yes stop_codon:yes gene_type:complete
MDCSICFDKITGEEQSVLKCDHTFHKECIDKWFEKSHRCPLCRNSLFNISCSDRQQNYWERVTESDELIKAETNIIFRDNIDTI